jgi:hypothetical protein
VIIASNIIFISAALLLRNQGTTTVMAVLIFMGMVSTFLIYQLRSRKHQLTSIKGGLTTEKESIQSHQILGLVSDAVEIDQTF